MNRECIYDEKAKEFHKEFAKLNKIKRNLL
jgi:hypothetical protein